MTVRHQPEHDPARWPKERTIVHGWDEVPVFANECEEQEFWSMHEMAAEMFKHAQVDDEERAIIERARQRRAAMRSIAG